MHNITERKRSEQDLNRAIQELKRANEDLEQFAYSASHDLQEPIRTVAIYSQMLKRRFENALGSEGNDYIAYTVDNALRLQQLVKDLLAYTQASGPGLGPPAVVNAGRAVEKVVQNLQPVVLETGARITHRDLPDVRIHKTQLEQLLQNVIGNAIKYRRADVPEVIIGARPDTPGRWLFSVTDNGIGIDARYHQQIFGIFKRLHVPAEYPGTGIGLAICRRIVERHGGTIWVDSELGRGTTVFFTLPAASGTVGLPQDNAASRTPGSS
jgi:light-regulated signal transduction histidine kinase (bacteriophytochrome)